MFLNKLRCTIVLAIQTIEFLFIHSASSQTDHLNFQHLNIVSGLSNANVTCLLKDSYGFMWFGTDDGLDRYDGYHFSVYKNDPNDPNSISSSPIKSILEDSQHNIWIGTTRGGISLYDRETDKFTHFLPKIDNEGSIIYTLFEDSRKQIWIGTNKGLFLFNNYTRTFLNYYHKIGDDKSISNNIIYSIFEDRKKQLWIGTANGLNLFDRSNGRFTRYFFDSKIIWSNNGIRCIYEGSDNNLWIATYSSGLIRLNPEKGIVQRYFYDKDKGNGIDNIHLLCITGDDNGNLYIGSENDGLYILSLGTEEFSHYGLDINDETSISSNSIYALHYYNDILWVGTYNGGVSFTSKQTSGFQYFKAGIKKLNNPYVLCITEDRQCNLWIGTDGGGINFFNRKTGLFKYYMHNLNDPHSISSNTITSIFEDSEGQIWAGTYLEGLCRLNTNTGKFTRYRHNSNDHRTINDDWIYFFFEDSKKNLFVVTAFSIDYFDRKTQAFSRIKYPVKKGVVLTMIEDRKGNIWLGNYDGLTLIDRQHNKLSLYSYLPNNKNKVIPSIVNKLYEDSKGHLWIGSEEGLYLFESNQQQFIPYPINTDNHNTSITGIVEDNHGNLWLSTNHNVFKMVDAINPPKKPIFIDYGSYDRLRGLCKSKNGDILFGGNFGLNILSPEKIVKNLNIPPVVLTNFKIFNKNVDIGANGSPLKKTIAETRKIILKRNQSVIAFEFSVLNYIHPEKNQYAYVMENFEKEWNFVGNQHSATYTNLSPGEYIFKVKGSNNDGVWNEKGVSLIIKILPPLYLTWWAYSFYFIMVACVVFLLRKNMLTKVQLKHNLEIEHIEKEKLNEINQMKSRFFRNLSHEFRTPLTLIISPLGNILSNTSFKPALNMQFHVILNNAKKLLQLINQLLDLSKIEANHMLLKTKKENIVPIIKDIIMLFAPLAESKQISFQFFVINNLDKNDSIDVYFDQEKLDKIVSNLISNAIKYTPDGGKIHLTIQKFTDVKYIDIPGTINNSKYQKAGSNFAANFKQGYVEIIVRDSGIGLHESDINRVFDLFYQVEKAQTINNEGSGIGLTLTKELVELHHGTIHAESNEGEGTAFIVRLPLGKEHLKIDEILNFPYSHESFNHSPNVILEGNDNSYNLETMGESKTSYKNLAYVLIIEDNDELRKYLQNSLNIDFQISLAKDGQEGFKKAIERIPDLIISDVMMPGMDGFELCKKIKSDKRTSHIPVILLTAKATKESKIEGLETGADDYLTKPFDMKELHVRINNLIEQRQKLRLLFNKKEGLKIDDIVTTSIDKRFLEKVLFLIEQNMSDPEFGVEELSGKIGLSRVQLYRKLNSLTGQSASEFIRVFRLNRAAQLLKQQHDTITQIAYLVGFNSQSYFSHSFYKQFGVYPSDYTNSIT